MGGGSEEMKQQKQKSEKKKQTEKGGESATTIVQKEKKKEVDASRNPAARGDEEGRVIEPVAHRHGHGDEEEGTEDAIDESVLDEGSFYLSRLGMSPKAIADRFEIGEDEVVERIERFKVGLEQGGLVEEAGGIATDFWKSVREEAEGNVKVTFVSKKGFHHAWRSDLRKLDGPTLLSIYDACKDFLNLDPSARFLEYDAPKNYDPLAMQREISKAVVVVGALLEEKWNEEAAAGRDAAAPR